MGSSTRGLRAVRLSRLNPGLMKRLDDVRHSGEVSGEDAESVLIQAQKQASAAALPFHKGEQDQWRSSGTGAGADSKQKWPLSLGASPLWEGLDPPQGLSGAPRASQGGAAANSRRVSGVSGGHLGLRRLPGEPLGPFERDRLLDSFSQFRQGGGHLPAMSASTTHFGATPGVDFLADESQSQELEALQQRCLDLEALVAELRSSKRRKSKGTASLSGAPEARSVSGSPQPDGLSHAAVLAANEAAAEAEATLVKTLRRAEEAEGRNEVLVAELAAATARLVETEDAANSRVAAAAASLRASEAACLGAVEAAQDATEARNRAEQKAKAEAATAERATGAERVATAAAKAAEEDARRARLTARSLGYRANEVRAAAFTLDLKAAAFAGWQLWLSDHRMERMRAVIEAREQQLSNAEASAAAAEARAQVAAAAAATAEASNHLQNNRPNATARARVLRGMEASIRNSQQTVMLTVIAAWRTSLQTRRTAGSLQAALFAEEADRASALRAQRSECDVLLLQAEARHRIAQQKFRSELAEAQAKQSASAAAERISALQAAYRSESSVPSARPSLEEPEDQDNSSTEEATSPTSAAE
eukprot:TRINITY_DN13724_c0_g1_i1.p1 TRINITY_DN13724_c0_g1~~TRINITY_DN13724_c0_g1_i1.p1  ORF type:complete len:658 (+),score=175.15 TRINITY_DN13724_c0_g1_i1:198-1976(+)